MVYRFQSTLNPRWLQDVDEEDGFVKAPRALHEGYDAQEAQKSRNNENLRGSGCIG